MVVFHRTHGSADICRVRPDGWDGAADCRRGLDDHAALSEPPASLAFVPRNHRTRHSRADLKTRTVRTSPHTSGDFRPLWSPNVRLCPFLRSRHNCNARLNWSTSSGTRHSWRRWPRVCGKLSSYGHSRDRRSGRRMGLVSSLESRGRRHVKARVLPIIEVDSRTRLPSMWRPALESSTRQARSQGLAAVPRTNRTATRQSALPRRRLQHGRKWECGDSASGGPSMANGWFIKRCDRDDSEVASAGRLLSAAIRSSSSYSKASAVSPRTLVA